MYKYNKSQDLFEHISRYQILSDAYDKVITSFGCYQDKMGDLIELWENLPLDDKVKYGVNLENLGIKHICGFDRINNFDVLNLWYTKRVDRKTELTIADCYNPISGRGGYITIFMMYKNFRFEVTNQSKSIKVSYSVTQRDVFNLLLHVYCNGEVLRWDIT